MPVSDVALENAQGEFVFTIAALAVYYYIVSTAGLFGSKKFKNLIIVILAKNLQFNNIVTAQVVPKVPFAKGIFCLHKIYSLRWNLIFI
ncbi:MAG: hypothetical protein V1655_04415 [bacterium]